MDFIPHSKGARMSPQQLNMHVMVLRRRLREIMSELEKLETIAEISRSCPKCRARWNRVTEILLGIKGDKVESQRHADAEVDGAHEKKPAGCDQGSQGVA